MTWPGLGIHVALARGLFRRRRVFIARQVAFASAMVTVLLVILYWKG
jgi:hypothetical protein